MSHRKDTSSLTPLRAVGFALSMTLTVGVLVAPQAAFAQSTPAPNSSLRSSTTLPAAATEDEGDIPIPSNGTTSAADNAAQGATAAAIAAPDQKPSDETTGAILDEDMIRLNTREAPLDERLPPRKPEPNPATEETPGIRIGTFVLRPAVTQSINTETQKDGGVKQTRAFLETDMHTTLTSDWALHQLLVTTEGAWQKNVSGEGEEQPDFRIIGDLRLDLAQDTTAHISGGYHFYREDTDDPNAVQNADKQSDVQEFSAGASIERDFGILRGATGIGLSRAIYSDATLSDGTTISLGDRNETSGTIRGRIGYELSPALIPFIEANVGTTVYDERVDSAGFRRSGDSYGAKVGVELDMGEKLRGEVGVGYETATFDDPRLSNIDTAVVDAQLLWSPLRGTDVNIGLLTSINPSTTAGESGYVSHALTTGLTHQLRDNLTGTVLGGITWRDYPSDSSTSDETVYATSAGLIWNLNRYLDLTSTIGYELTSRKTSSDSEQWRAGVGLKLKR
ncbi:outer membrane beta-barrel protein [Rhizobium tibeticum]|uniref:outer membrane beta-barrel protein n=1 Tax=Rhizobium tibeticum TaxID=501024 RepID=UPI0027D8C8E7|nr:outer membrane beta-barrel protein [Rhizobium tibeticum]